MTRSSEKILDLEREIASRRRLITVVFCVLIGTAIGSAIALLVSWWLR